MPEAVWFADPPPLRGPRVAVIGAGLAGCATAAHLCRAGFGVSLIDSAAEIAGATSGNRAGLVNPRLTGEPNLDRYYRAAADYFFPYFADLCARAPVPPEYAFDGVDGSKQQDAHTGGWLAPRSFCRAQLSLCSDLHYRLNTTITSIRAVDRGWQLLTQDGALFETDAVVLTQGYRTAPLQIDTHYLRPHAGQVTLVDSAALPRPLARPFSRQRHYGISLPDGVTLCGAVNRRAEAGPPQAQADLQNLAALAAYLGADSPPDSAILGARTGTRATTPDHLPVVGGVPDEDFFASAYAMLHHGKRHRQWPPARYLPGLYILNGLGSHGILGSPFLAHLLVNLMRGNVKQDTRDAIHLLHPARFILRQLRRKPADRKS
ncbi:FAD-dependent oxidoreductase [Granulosicoccaceae sp. 1_MG-2023]|nr:FAD-dependent oxidoreductase [Granulosicoccaceae sp. 1_MG-2023]